MLWVILLTFLVVYLRGALRRRDTFHDDGHRSREPEICTYSMERCGCRVGDKTPTDALAV
jgi:hypothetical protein